MSLKEYKYSIATLVVMGFVLFVSMVRWDKRIKEYQNRQQQDSITISELRSENMYLHDKFLENEFKRSAGLD